MSEEVRIASVDDVPEGGGMTAEVGGRMIALFNIGGEIYAIENTCPHQGGSLADGFIDGTTITCPNHDWKFDLETGQGIMPPSPGVKAYPVEIRDNDIYIEV
ncbi:MAG: nitrite reductase small subunit NirD [Nanoarchaeota archaeon]